MSTTIVQSAPNRHLHPDVAAQRRAERLAMATPEQMETALAYLSVIDCEAFEIAFTAVADDHAGDDDPFPVCRRCGRPVGIFPDQNLAWQHFIGDATTSGTHATYDPGHQAEVIWLLPDEDPETV